MTEKQRDRVFTFSGSLIASIIVVLVAFSLNAKRDDSKELIYKIDNKVDKSEFQKKCDENEVRFSNIEKTQAESIDKNTMILQELVKQNATMQTDIAWIKREIDKKKY